MNPIHIISKSESISDIPVYTIGVFNVEDAKLAFGAMRYTMVVALNENTHKWYYFTNLKDCEEFFKVIPSNFSKDSRRCRIIMDKLDKFLESKGFKVWNKGGKIVPEITLKEIQDRRFNIVNKEKAKE